MASVKRIRVHCFPVNKANELGDAAWAEVEKFVEEEGWSVVTAVPLLTMGNTQSYDVILQKS